jgi:hypothetical protein
VEDAAAPAHGAIAFRHFEIRRRVHLEAHARTVTASPMRDHAVSSFLPQAHGVG